MKKSIVCICVLVLCLLFQSCEYDFEPADGGTKSEKTTTTTVTTRGKNISPPSEGGNGEGDPYDFIITYSIKNSQYYPGDKFTVEITANNCVIKVIEGELVVDSIMFYDTKIQFDNTQKITDVISVNR